MPCSPLSKLGGPNGNHLCSIQGAWNSRDVSVVDKFDYVRVCEFYNVIDHLVFGDFYNVCIPHIPTTMNLKINPITVSSTGTTKHS